MKRNVYSPCPCSASESNNETAPVYADCCQPFIEQTRLPETAEKLMRSRYSAFVLEKEHYLLASWHPDHRPASIDFDEHCKWLGLKIKQTRAGLPSDKDGWVEFVARYKIAGKAQRIEERSYFIKADNRWLYVTAVEEMDKQ